MTDTAKAGDNNEGPLPQGKKTRKPRVGGGDEDTSHLCNKKYLDAATVDPNEVRPGAATFFMDQEKT